MSAPNYYSKAGTVYAVDVEDAEDQWLVVDIQENVLEALTTSGLIVEAEDEHDGERSYPGTCYGTVTLKTARDDINVHAKLIARSGYFSGCNLDYDLQVYNSYTGDYIDVTELTASDVIEACAVDRQCTPAMFNRYQKQGRVVDYRAPGFYSTYTCGIAPTQKQVDRIIKQLYRDYETLKKAIDQVYKSNTVALRRLGVFSNGEAIYEKM